MQNATYTIKIEDLLEVEDERKRWILVKKALAANVGQESTRAVEFGYISLDYATDHLRRMMEDQSETMTLPAGLEPFDPSDDEPDPALLIPFAREKSVRPGVRVPSRRKTGRVLETVAAADDVEEVQDEGLVSVLEAPAGMEPAAEVSVTGEADIAPAVPTVEPPSAVMAPELVEEVAEAGGGAVEAGEEAEVPEIEAQSGDVVTAGEAGAVPPALAADGAPDAPVGDRAEEAVEEQPMEPQATQGPEETAGVAAGRQDDERVEEAGASPEAEATEAAEGPDATLVQAVSGGAGAEAPVRPEAPEGTYLVDVEAVLAVANARTRRILARKAAAVVVGRRYTSSIGKYIREAGSLEALVRSTGPWLTVPSGYEPYDSTDEDNESVSLAAFAAGGEAAAMTGKPIPRVMLRKPRNEGAAEAAKPEGVAGEPEVVETASEERRGRPARRGSDAAVTEATASASFAARLSFVVSEALAPYLAADGRFKDGREGVAASEYLARVLEAEAARVRLAAYGRGEGR